MDVDEAIADAEDSNNTAFSQDTLRSEIDGKRRNRSAASVMWPEIIRDSVVREAKDILKMNLDKPSYTANCA